MPYEPSLIETLKKMIFFKTSLPGVFLSELSVCLSAQLLMSLLLRSIVHVPAGKYSSAKPQQFPSFFFTRAVGGNITENQSLGYQRWRGHLPQSFIQYNWAKLLYTHLNLFSVICLISWQYTSSRSGSWEKSQHILYSTSKQRETEAKGVIHSILHLVNYYWKSVIEFSED